MISTKVRDSSLTNGDLGRRWDCRFLSREGVTRTEECVDRPAGLMIRVERESCLMLNWLLKIKSSTVTGAREGLSSIFVVFARDKERYCTH
jgi:hypothetical protein